MDCLTATTTRTRVAPENPRRLVSPGLPACMGGWCTIREACPRYGAQTGVDPVERLCEQNRDGTINGYPVRVVRPAGSWERRLVPSMLRPADPFDALRAVA